MNDDTATLFMSRCSAIVLLMAGALAGCSEQASAGANPADAAASTDAPTNSCGGKGAFVIPSTARTPGGEFSVTLTEANPREFALGDSDWTLHVDGADGKPAPGLTFKVVPWMTEHNHGAVKAVVVTDLGDGDYEAKPINVNMPGIWDVRVEFPSDGGTALRAVLSFCANAR